MPKHCWKRLTGTVRIIYYRNQSMNIFDDMGKFIKEVVEKVEDAIEDIFDGDDKEETEAE